MNLRQLEVFRAVVEHGSTTEAAVALGVSQPSVSNLIRHTEDQIGFKLFMRARRGLIPTEAAKALYRESDPMFSLAQGFGRTIENIRNGLAGQINLVSTPSVGHTLLPVAIDRFLDRRPKVEFNLDIRAPDHVQHYIEMNLVNLGLTPALLLSSQVRLEELLPIRLVVMMREDHPLASKERLVIGDLENERIVMPTTSSVYGAAGAKWLRQANVAVRRPILTRYCDSACLIAQATRNIALVDELTPMALNAPGCIFRPLEGGPEIPCYLYYSSHRELSPVETQFVETLRTVASELTALRDRRDGSSQLPRRS